MNDCHLQIVTNSKVFIVKVGVYSIIKLGLLAPTFVTYVTICTTDDAQNFVLIL